MFRLLFRFIQVLIILGLIRWAVSVAVRLFFPPRARERPTFSQTQATGSVPSSGEFKRDPVCGTFVLADTSLRQTVSGKEVYFCSAACRDKFRAA